MGLKTNIIPYRLSDALTFTHKDGTPAREPAIARLSIARATTDGTTTNGSTTDGTTTNGATTDGATTNGATTNGATTVGATTDGATTDGATTNGCRFDGPTLILIADMTDSDIYNTAERNNVKTWLTGDVLEFFFQPPGRADYYEFHVTPTGKTLQLHMPTEQAAFNIPFEDKICETGFRHSVEVEQGLWRVRMEIPLSALNCQTAAGARFIVCRQNYSHAWTEPDISVTSPLKGSVHSPDEWLRIV